LSIVRTAASNRAARKVDNALGPVSAKILLDWVIESKSARASRVVVRLPG
jgi:hypothetical protein